MVLFDFIRLPFDIHETIYLEEIIEKKLIELEDAKITAINEFENRCNVIIGSDGIVKEKSYSFEYNKNTNSLKLIGELVYIKNIAVEKPFEVN